MANDLASRQWRLDTPTAFGLPGAILWESNIRMVQAEFSGYTSQSDQCILKDKNGRTVWGATGSTGLQPVRLGDIGWVDGLCLDTLTSGLCIVYIR